MKTAIALTIAVLICFTSCNTRTGSIEMTGEPDIKTEKGKLSYSFGISIGTSVKTLDIDLDFNTLARGIYDVMTDKNAKMTGEEANQYIQMAMSKIESEKALEKGQKGKEFLEANKKKPGVATTTSGLQYFVIKEGDGPKPSETDTVSVHYTGTFIDGTVFDSSVERGEPVRFPVNGVIKGWTEGLQLMSKGSKYKFFIPPELAYGEQGAGGAIGPNETLIFEVELLDIVP